MPAICFTTAIGRLRVAEEDSAIVAVRWIAAGDDDLVEETPLLREARLQITDYAKGARRVFDLPLRVAGGELQEAVWREMCAIPYGQTRTYGDLAKSIGSEARAVGAACGQNPVPIIIPCHRVVGAGMRLTGFSGGDGTETKRALLTLEGALLI